MRLLFITLILCLSLYSPRAHAQVKEIKFSGTIFDMDTKVGVQGSTFLITDKKTQKSIQTKTDDLGKYTFTLPQEWIAGEYPMSIQKDGYYLVNGIVLVQDKAVRNFYIKAMPSKKPDTLLIPAIVSLPIPQKDTVPQAPQLISPQKEIKPTLASLTAPNLLGRKKSTHLSIIIHSSCEKAPILNELGKISKNMLADDRVSLIWGNDTSIQTLNAVQLEQYISKGNFPCDKALRLDLAYEKAYEVARKNYIQHGNNKILLLSTVEMKTPNWTERNLTETIIRKAEINRVKSSVIQLSTANSVQKLSLSGAKNYSIYKPEEIVYTIIQEMKVF